jgi:hypothetical protein
MVVLTEEVRRAHRRSGVALALARALHRLHRLRLRHLRPRPHRPLFRRGTEALGPSPPVLASWEGWGS